MSSSSSTPSYGETALSAAVLLNSPPSSSRMTSPLFRSPNILLEVIEHIDFLTLLALRLVNRATYDLICNYESSIAQSMARRMSDDCPCLLQETGRHKPSIAWLFTIVAQRLATVAVDRARCRGFWGVPAADPLGAAVRERVKNGWCILGQLSNVAQRVGRLPDAQFAPRPSYLRQLFINHNQEPSHKDIILGRESSILQSRRELVQKLSPQDARDYCLMMDFMSIAWSTINVGFGSFESLADLGNSKMGTPSVWAKDSWVNWLILRDGPFLFHELWGAFDNKRMERINRIQQEWEARSPWQVRSETDSARCVNRDLDAKRSSVPDFAGALTNTYEEAYKAACLGRKGPNFKETMDGVPFLIDGLPPMSVIDTMQYYLGMIRCFGT